MMTPIFKAIEIAETPVDNIIELKVTGKLTAGDYNVIITELEKRIKNFNRIRLLIELHDFHGWTAGALWEDVKFDFKHFSDIERCAVVGESRWEKGMTLFFKPFTAAAVRYFDHNKLEEARKWIREI